MTTNRRHRSSVRVAMAAIALAWLGVLVLGGTRAEAQIPGRLGQMIDKGSDALQNLRISDEQEQQIGEGVSQRIRDRYGVVQDPAVTRYVSLVGMVLAQAGGRPKLPWKFIVLDTDGVNAFAAPGGYIHITRGALALMNNEAELADALAHEIIHVTEKHTIAAIKKGKMIQMGADQAPNLSYGSDLFNKMVDVSTDIVLKGFGRKEELEADEKGIALANKVGYSPSGLIEFLTRLNDRNKGSTIKQGLFASHPEMQERLDRLRTQIKDDRLTSTATLEDRYHKFVTYKPTPQADIAVVEGGAAGLTGDTTKKEEPKKDEPKKKGFGLGSLLAPSSGSEKKSAEVTGSAAARGVDRELGAKGGPVKTIVAVTLSAADIAAFKKDGNLK